MSPSSGAPVDVTAIIVNFNTRDLLSPCLGALRAGSDGLVLQIVLVDNGSSDGSLELMRSMFADTCEIVASARNLGFGRANNLALPRARGRYVLLLNTDAFIGAGGVAPSVRYLDAHGECGVLGARLEGRDGSLQPSCRTFPTPWNEFVQYSGLARWFPGTRLIDDMSWDHTQARRCDWVPGCFYMVRRSAIDQLGLFDPRFFLYYEEVDHCKAVKDAGWEVVYCPDTTVVHLGGESAKGHATLHGASRQVNALAIESALLYFRKRHGLSGVIAKAAFTVCGDILGAARLVARGRVHAALESWSQSLVTLRLLARTRLGMRPLR